MTDQINRIGFSTMQAGGAIASCSISLRDAGLCADCVHARQIRSDRGSIFVQCQLSFTDARFPKYPRLPVLICSGYERGDGGGYDNCPPSD